MADKNKIGRALSKVQDPEIKKSLVELDMIKHVADDDGSVTVTVALTTGGCPLKDRISEEIKSEVGKVPGVREVKVVMTEMTGAEKEALALKLRGPKPSLSLSPETKVIGVASGKGGVGKSTVAVNLAAAMAATGRRTGILDADIWGFSIPRMLGIGTRPAVADNLIIPLDKFGLKIMSIGFFVPEDQPLIWRGPMVHKALEQFLTQVLWGDDLEYLFVDLPPGTGDVTITLGKLVPRLSLVMVTTPQPAAAKVAVRSGHMAHKMAVDVVGVVENMSYFDCEACGRPNYIFGKGGGEELSRSLGVPLLGRLPFDPEARTGGDLGEPIVLSAPEGQIAAVLGETVARLEAVVAPDGARPSSRNSR